MKDPTSKQMEFAAEISRVLEIPMPEVKTRQSLFLFIRDNKPKFDAAMSHQRDCFDNEFDTDPDQDYYYMTVLGLDPYTGSLND